jgi:hypothetical protein
MAKPKKLTINDLKSVMAGVDQDFGKKRGEIGGKKLSVEDRGKIKCMEGYIHDDGGGTCGNSGNDLKKK